ncbi:Ubiquitin-like modifier-activating enzyme atg7, partial [Neolecta irregularis DAH-3]
GVSKDDCIAIGTIKNFNTIEAFKSVDKAEFLDDAGDEVLQNIDDGTSLADPSTLVYFKLLTFADLKKYVYYSWIAVPALLIEPLWTFDGPDSLEVIPPSDLSFRDTVEAWKQTVEQNQWGFFLFKRIRNEWVIGKVCELQDKFWSNTAAKDRMIGFVDPSKKESNPGWPLRNFLSLIRRRIDLQRIKVLCYRDSPLSETSKSVILHLSIEIGLADPLGWEKNQHDKIAAKIMDLGPMMDPTKLSDTAVNLNLKLMRWRIAPDLKLEKIKRTRCLLVGAGTLGCNIARGLMGWGVQHITFVDSAKISYSNPVRQSLYTFQDCLDGGKPKAVRAADALREIYPGISSSGVELTIPMPGHPIINEPRFLIDFRHLEELVKNSDAIFLLTDSRESRWLLSLLGAAHNKLVINAALGFESYLVMRHGVPSQSPRLGCYFCSDIVAPADSLRDRAFDQMCTVTRPGVAFIASGLAVELMVSTLQHPDGVRADALTTEEHGKSPKSSLGLVPHQIRGFLGSFSQLTLRGPANDRCSACSPVVIEKYETEGSAFILRVLDTPGYIEEVSGLAEIQRSADAAEQVTIIEDSDDNGELN